MKQRQAGASLIGWLIILVLIGFIALVGIRVMPIYMESFTVRSELNRLADSEVSAKDRPALVSAFLRRMAVNNVNSIGRDDIQFETVTGGLEMTVDYERRFPIAGNLDGVASFRFQTLIRD